ncbi:hypothetical protein ACROYT_G002383 [Oculina patagonica]
MIALILLALAVFAPSFSEGCGMRPTFARVINGQNASPHSWPWQVSLRVRGRHICGGSLVRPDWIVTAAHCVYRNPNPSGYTVVVGAHMRTGITDVQQTFRVKALYKHSDFTMQNLKHDIAVLQLEGSAQLSDKVTTVCLPDKDADLSSKCYITGWGRTHFGAANTLQQAKLPLVSHNDCRKTWRTIDRSAHLCAGEGRAGASGGCNGDSGGPLVCEVGGKWYLHGAVSFGMKDCPTTHFTVFARVTSYRSWILEKIGDGSNGPNPPLPPQTPRPPMTTRPPPQPGCEDGWGKEYCYNHRHRCSWPFVRNNCRATCGAC